MTHKTIAALRAIADDCRARGLTEQQVCDEVMRAGLLTLVPCPRHTGDECDVCNGDGAVFRVEALQ